MDYNVLAELLFPNVTETCEEVHARFPKRDVPEGAVVTRMAPSPTTVSFALPQEYLHR